MDELYHAYEDKVYRRTDRFFFILMALQWLVGILFAAVVSPRAWSGANSSVHPHIYAAILLGGSGEVDAYRVVERRVPVHLLQPNPLDEPREFRLREAISSREVYIAPRRGSDQSSIFAGGGALDRKTTKIGTYLHPIIVYRNNLGAFFGVRRGSAALDRASGAAEV